jgi:predicted restriction endonuclease
MGRPAAVVCDWGQTGSGPIYKNGSPAYRLKCRIFSTLTKGRSTYPVWKKNGELIWSKQIKSDLKL